MAIAPLSITTIDAASVPRPQIERETPAATTSASPDRITPSAVKPPSLSDAFTLDGVFDRAKQKSIDRHERRHGHETNTYGAGGSVELNASPEQAAAIKRGEHQISVVNGKKLELPSQDITMIESQTPEVHGQTHIGLKHVGQSLADDVARLQNEPHIAAAGGFTDVPTAQKAIDQTIAADQNMLRSFMNDPGRVKTALPRVALNETIGTNVTRADFNAGHPQERAATTATVVMIKDKSFPEGYRILTAYPEASRAPEVDLNGKGLPPK